MVLFVFRDELSCFYIDLIDWNRMNANTARTSNTKITDLNDDCVLEVFNHLDFSDLCAAADVSRRFRLNAQIHFTTPKFSNVLVIHFYEGHEQLFVIPQPDCPVDKTCTIYNGPKLTLISISKVLRNFGAFIKSINFLGMRWGKCESTQKNDKEKKIFQLISVYCSGTLMVLKLNCCTLSGETENTLRPVLLHLRGLILHECKYSNFFAQMLSLWTPNLRALHFTSCSYTSDEYFKTVMRVDDILRQTFVNLFSIKFILLPNVNNADIEEFVKRHPQLKKIGLLNCSNVDGSVFQSIATHAPDVEIMEIDRVSTIDDINLRHIGKFNCLHTLKLYTYSWPSVNPVDHSFMPSILQEIHASNIPLRQLQIRGCGTELFKRTDQLVDAILKIETLEDLCFIRFGTLKISHIHNICKQVKLLSSLTLCNTYVFISAGDLLAMIKYAPKLKSLHYLEGPRTLRNAPFRWRKPDEIPECIDEYMKMVEIVGQRRERQHLLIELTPWNPILKMLPEDITRKFKHILTIAVAKEDCSTRWVQIFMENFDM